MSLLILGIESSCDETGVALVRADDGAAVPRLLAHALHSQIAMHQDYGGVVPELASRDHIRRVLPLTETVLQDAARLAELSELVAPAKAIFLDAKIESELIELDPADAKELLESIGQEESGLDQLARVGFDTLGLQTYLTAGPKEARAWTIRKGATAPQAAGVIHGDFEKGFIKGEIISFEDLVACGSVAEARAKGKARMEGKEYVMQDGDVCEWRHGNVSATKK